MNQHHWNDSECLFLPASAPDFLPIPQLRSLQLQRLRATVKRCYEHVALFRSRMEAKGLTPADIRTLDDIRLLPFTEKSDLRDTYPFGLFASPMSDIVRLHASSGTTGKPIVVAYTQNDIDVWKNVIQRTFACAGVGRGDIIQNAYGYGLFTGGLGVHYGAEALGATVIPVSGGNTDRQLMLMRDFGITVICCTPTYFLHIIDHAEKIGVDIRKLPLRAGFFGAEPWTEEMRKRIEEMAGIKAYDIYGLSEIIGPGVGAESKSQDGLHIFEDHFFPEIVDPKTGESLPDGEEGELVLSTLSKEAMPILRYRTHDITSILTSPSGCGRTIRRIRRINRRSDDMFIIRGVNVFPSQIETAILQIEDTLPHYLIILTRKDNLDQITIQVEVTEKYFSDKISELQSLRQRLAHAVEQIIGIRAELQLVEPRTLARSEGKLARVSDRRQSNPN